MIFILTKEGFCATQHDFQIWPNVTVTGPFNKGSRDFNRFKYWLENQERIGDDSKHVSQTLLRSGIGYMLSDRASLWLGYAWIRTSFPLTTQPFNEDRIWQQLFWTKSINSWTFTSRTRTEQRFMANNRKTAYRIRQFVKLAIPFKNHPKLYFVNFDELFWHKNNFIGRNSKGFDQNRFFTGLGYQFNSETSVEIGYLNQYIRRFGVPNFLANALSINLFINF